MGSIFDPFKKSSKKSPTYQNLKAMPAKGSPIKVGGLL
jgi:hypothetical protein